MKKKITKLLVLIIIFLITLIVCNKSSSAKKYINKYLFEKNINFSFFRKTTNKLIGKNDFIKEEGLTKPVFSDFLDYTSEEYLDGTLFTYNSSNVIKALNGGLVVYLGDKENIGNTVIIQGNDGIDIWYGLIDNASVSLYDYVTKGQIIGETTDNKTYIKIDDNGKIIDYKTYLNEN